MFFVTLQMKFKRTQITPFKHQPHPAKHLHPCESLTPIPSKKTYMKYFRLYLSISVALILCSCDGIQKRMTINKILDSIEEANDVDMHAHLFPERSAKLDSVFNLASYSEVIEICSSHSNACVRMAMFFNFAERFPHEAVKITLENADDTATFKARWVDIVSELHITTSRYDYLQRMYEDGNEGGITQKEMESLDSMMIFSPYIDLFLEECSDFAITFTPKAEYYDIVKSKSKKVKNNDQLSSILAKYKKPAEKQYISENLKKILANIDDEGKAWEMRELRDQVMSMVSYWPDDDFENDVKQILTKIFKHNSECIAKKKENNYYSAPGYEIRFYDLRALYAYKKQWAYDLFLNKVKEDYEQIEPTGYPLSYNARFHDSSGYFKPIIDLIVDLYKKKEKQIELEMKHYNDSIAKIRKW